MSGLGLTTLWGLLKSGKLEAVRIGQRTLVTYRSLEALLAPRSEPAPRPPGTAAQERAERWRHEHLPDMRRRHGIRTRSESPVLPRRADRTDTMS